MSGLFLELACRLAGALSNSGGISPSSRVAASTRYRRRGGGKRNGRSFSGWQTPKGGVEVFFFICSGKFPAPAITHRPLNYFDRVRWILDTSVGWDGKKGRGGVGVRNVESSAFRGAFSEIGRIGGNLTLFLTTKLYPSPFRAAQSPTVSFTSDLFFLHSRLFIFPLAAALLALPLARLKCGWCKKSRVEFYPPRGGSCWKIAILYASTKMRKI